VAGILVTYLFVLIAGDNLLRYRDEQFREYLVNHDRARFGEEKAEIAQKYTPGDPVLPAENPDVSSRLQYLHKRVPVILHNGYLEVRSFQP
jgi:hypothetical protein